MKINTVKELAQIFASEVEKAEAIYLFHHIRPDGDCLGAVFGLKAVLTDRFPNKKIQVIGNNYANFSFLPMDFWNDYQNINYQKGLAIIVDCDQVERVENAFVLWDGAQFRFKTTICIDHHQSLKLSPFSYYYDNGNYPAVCQIIVEIVKKLKWHLSPWAATFFYLGIYTDTNRFLYDSVTTETLLAAVFCWSHGAKKDLIHNQLSKQDSQSLKIKAHILANYQQIDRVSYFYFDLTNQRRLGILDPFKANMPGIIANIDASLIWIFFTQETNHQIRCEFRSNQLNLRPLAQSLGGGGHPLAAGAIIKSADQIPVIIAQAVELVKSQNQD